MVWNKASHGLVTRQPIFFKKTPIQILIGRSGSAASEVKAVRGLQGLERACLLMECGVSSLDFCSCISTPQNLIMHKP